MITSLKYGNIEIYFFFKKKHSCVSFIFVYQVSIYPSSATSTSFFLCGAIPFLLWVMSGTSGFKNANITQAWTHREFHSLAMMIV